jgi:hypothetical protein
MTILCPTPQWPSGLLEVGPEQDPSILLRSVAEIAGAAYEVIAIRVDPITMAADLRGDVPRNVYRNLRVDGMLDELSVFTDISDQSLVRLSTGAYVMLMFPAGNT